MYFKTPYDPDSSVDDVIYNNEPSLTEKFHADSVDINNIVDQYLRGATVPGNSRVPRYIDCTDIMSYQDSLDMVRCVNEQFDSLPAKLRGFFDNDPGQYFEFVNDPDNLEESIRLGLIDQPTQKTDESLSEPEADDAQQQSSAQQA